MSVSIAPPGAIATAALRSAGSLLSGKLVVTGPVLKFNEVGKFKLFLWFMVLGSVQIETVSINCMLI